MAARATPEAGAAGEGKIPPKIIAEASVWMAQLHGERRNAAMERDFQEWLARSPLHRRAFERSTDLWMLVPGVNLANIYKADAERPAQRWWASWWSVGGGVATAALAVCLLLWQPWRSADQYSTGVGELQQLVLADGTRMLLNTHTRVRVDIRRDVRNVSVQSGEALFEVAKDPTRPFVVRAGGSEVVALGTAFSVRLAPDTRESLDVVLLEGQVQVRAAKDGGGIAPDQPVRMEPGQRVRLLRASSAANSAAASVDRPRLDQVVAWRRNEAIFQDTPLADAVAEMNRYSRVQIVLMNDSALKARRINGQYRTGDNGAFARAVAALYGLKVQEKQGHLELSPN